MGSSIGLKEVSCTQGSAGVDGMGESEKALRASRVKSAGLGATTGRGTGPPGSKIVELVILDNS